METLTEIQENDPGALDTLRGNEHIKKWWIDTICSRCEEFYDLKTGLPELQLVSKTVTKSHST